jgi:BirA family biotin operon repressor/biotin-[acetyl-CoA-carboxylase] ligase
MIASRYQRVTCDILLLAQASGGLEMIENNLSSASITNDLETHFVGQKVIYSRRLTSTMEVARQEAQQGAVEGTVIVADEQTVGRGRIRRKWLSPKGGIALSIILYPDVAYLPFLIMLASLAVVYSIKAVTDLKSAIKWPNDVLVNGRKVCGILIESDVRRKKVGYTIIGIGLNVNLRLSDFPEISQTATSLSDELGRTVSHLDMIRCLLVEVERLYSTLQAGGSIYEAWRDNLVILGKSVHITEGETAYEGIAESVARDGSLLLRQSNGRLVKIVAGDVTLRY